MSKPDRFRGALLGLAVGDALGAPVEFAQRDTFKRVKDMQPGGWLGLEAGQWTDDTSMALCLAESLLAIKGHVPEDQVARYIEWRDWGHNSWAGRCIDIGGQTSRALEAREARRPVPNAEHEAGNGSLMRLAPVPMWYHRDFYAAWYYSGESSKVTHPNVECVDACRFFGGAIAQALAGASKESILTPFTPFKEPSTEKVAGIAAGCYTEKSRDEIRSTGYVVDSLEAACWCFWLTDSFEDAVIEAVNLGGDADTVGAITGQLAGAFYGESAIPARWLARLPWRERIGNTAELLQGGG